ncbi:MAG TPA: ExbD/TolR family protein [Candidatus Brocadiia bacterium]|nr:biopolymer transporter ExbD [Candidatus Brocadiales bacterium]
MEFREKRSFKIAINIAPMVDMLFMLLIFFIVTSTFVEQPNIKLELPTAKHSEMGKTEQLTLIISREGKLYLQNEAIERKDLEMKLKDVFAQRQDKSLVLKADKLVPYGIVIDVMDAAKSVGLRKIIAPTAMEQKEPTFLEKGELRKN